MAASRFEEPPLDCPLTAFGGRDDPLVTMAGLEGWRAQTSRRFAVHVLPGGHFFLRTQQAVTDHVFGKSMVLG